MRIAAILVCVAGMSASSFANEGHMHPKMPKEFDTMKQLVGTWEGMTKKDGKEMPATVTYSLTSGGTAIEEKLMPGTPHEMLTVYSRDGKTLGLTHYCAIGNDPHMMLKKADDKTLAFEMPKGADPATMAEPHMHALTLKMADADSLTHEWVMYEHGKQVETTVFNFKRKK